MHWVIQNNLFNEEANEILVDMLDRFEIPYTLVKVIPFGGGIEPDLKFKEDEKVVVVGSVALVKHAQNKGWTPGAWFDDSNFNYETYNHFYGSVMLNRYGYFIPFKYVPLYFPKFEEGFFLRPVADGKEFAGTVYKNHWDFLEWYLRIAKGDSMWTVNMETPVMISYLTDITAEYRCIVVKGKVITSSQYKSGNRVLYDPYVPQYVIDFAQEMVDKWKPADVFVMDIAEALYHASPMETNPSIRKLKIVEINNFNSAGWYKCDVSKIVQAIEGL